MIELRESTYFDVSGKKALSSPKRMFLSRLDNFCILFVLLFYAARGCSYRNKSFFIKNTGLDKKMFRVPTGVRCSRMLDAFGCVTQRPGVRMGYSSQVQMKNTRTPNGSGAELYC